MIGLDRVFETVSGLFVALKQELATPILLNTDAFPGAVFSDAW